MTLPASGSISLSQIAAEFGGSAPHSLSEYYRGGAYVPNAPPNAGIPTSGAIDFTDFYGSSVGPAVYVLGVSTSAVGSSNAAATARGSIDSTGLQRSKSGTAAYVNENTWLNFGVNSDYEVRTTVTGTYGIGSIGGSAFNTWISCATGGEWTAVAAAGKVFGATILLEIRYVPTGTVLASGTIILDSERF